MSVKLPCINEVTISGRLTKEPELKVSSSNQPYTINSIAHDSYSSGENGAKSTIFINFSLWGSAAENLVKNAKKGSPVIIKGAYKTRKYTDKSGNEREEFGLRAFKVDVLEWLDNNTTTNNNVNDDDVPF